MSAEFNITDQIYQTKKTYKIEASFQHLYGHQYTKSRRKITNVAILNVEADRLVGDYQDKFGTYSSIMHMYQLSPVVQEINRMTITSNV